MGVSLGPHTKDREGEANGVEENIDQASRWEQGVGSQLWASVRKACRNEVENEEGVGVGVER